jgi:hypothetical protein
MKGYFVYMFLDIDDNVLYIGSSIHLVVRIEKQHFLSQHGNLSEECILESHKILYHQGVSSDDMKIKERYLINILEPKYNNKLNNNNKFSFTIDIDWKLYSLDTESLIEKRQKKNQSNKLINHSFDINTPSLVIEKANKNNYLRIPSLSNEDKKRMGVYPFFNDAYFMLINNEYYYHHFNNISSSIGYTLLNNIRTYRTLEFYNKEYGSKFFIWVECKENDNNLFEISESPYASDYYGEKEDKTTKNERDKRLLFINYDMLRASGRIIHDDDKIEFYNSILNIDSVIEREIPF